MRVWCVVPAAGVGRRMGAAEPKQFLLLGGRPVLLHTIQVLASWDQWAGIVVVAPEDRLEWTRGLLEGAGLGGNVDVVAGGDERLHSVWNGLDALLDRGAAENDLVFVHDGVRPFPPIDRFEDLVTAARPDGALLAVPCRDTLKREKVGTVGATVDRAGLWQAQTPQVFPLGLLREALAEAQGAGRTVTDEASAVEALGRRPCLLRGDPGNLKVTLPEDLVLAEKLLTPRPAAGLELSIGHGYDVHRLVEGRALVLGGVSIPHILGLLGHSDADVLAHAVGDACLGAAGLGDLGRHFPDTDDQWAGASSMVILERLAGMVEERGLRILRVDATLVAQRPKVVRYISAMEENLRMALGLPSGAATVKATTTEGLGLEGREEGISAHAVALVAPLENRKDGPPEAPTR